MEDKWLNAHLHTPPQDKPLLTRDLEGNEVIYKWNGVMFTFQGKPVLPQPVFWLDKK